MRNYTEEEAKLIELGSMKMFKNKLEDTLPELLKHPEATIEEIMDGFLVIGKALSEND